jgi:hypothetical protein
MIQFKNSLLFCSLGLFILSCSDEKKEDLTTDVNKNGAVESAIVVTPVNDTLNVLTTTHKVWVQGNVHKTIEYRDTLPALGTEQTTAENKDGDKKTVSRTKEYEIYITVK